MSIDGSRMLELSLIELLIDSVVKDEFSKEIEEEIAKLEKEDPNVTKIATNKETQNVVYDVHNKSIFADFVTYPDFINPFATYMVQGFFS